VGGLVLHNADGVASLLDRHQSELPPPFSELLTRDIGHFQGLACAEITATSIDDALAHLQDVIDILRLFQRSIARMRTTQFGLPTDVSSDRIRFLQLDGPYGVGWKHSGEHMGFTFNDDVVDKWTDSDFERLADAVSNGDDRPGPVRLMTAFRLLSRAVIEPRPTVRTLNVVIATECLLGGEAKSFQLARRAAYFTCGDEGDRCGRTRPACTIIASRPAHDMATLKRLDARTSAGNGYCSEWTNFVDRYADRSAAAHGRPTASVADRHASADLTWAIRSLLPETMRWWLDHPDADGKSIDAEIDALLDHDAGETAPT
jgi:hypothetical protein